MSLPWWLKNTNWRPGVDFSGESIAAFRFTGTSSQVAERWRQWKRSYQYYNDGKEITSPSRKKAQLLHLAVMAVQDIYEDLPDPGPVNGDEDNEYIVSAKAGCSFSSGGQRAVRATCFSSTRADTRGDR